MGDVFGSMKIVGYIPVKNMKDGYVYKVDSKKFKFALWNEKTRFFFGECKKAEESYIDSDDHFDEGGSVKPIKEICEYNNNYCPICGTEEDKKLIDFLKERCNYAL